jgi:hypothetical protein
MSAMPEVDAGAIDAIVAEAAVIGALAAEAETSKADGQTGRCPNCGAQRSGHFCANCGQKAGPVAPTFSYFAREFVHEVLSVDGKIFRSLRLLLTRPGFLTREIFAGRRASYVLPLRLYLVASVLAFALLTFLNSIGDVNIEYTPNPGETVDPAVVERMAEVERTVGTALAVWAPRAMFVLVPLFAAFVMLVRRRDGHTYPQHLYFALHVHAVGFFAIALNALLEPLLRIPTGESAAGIILGLYALVYFFVAFRRVYETTIWGTLWRTVTVGVLYSVAYMLAVIAIVAPTVSPLFVDQSP